MPDVKETDMQLVQPNQDVDFLRTVVAPLAETYLHQQLKESEARTKMHEQQMTMNTAQLNAQYQLHDKMLDINERKFNKALALLTAVVFFTLGLSAYLIVIGQSDKGLLVISHAVALTSGIFIGRNQRQESKKPDDKKD